MVLGDTVVGPDTMVFCVRSSDVVAVDWVVVDGLTVEISAVSVLAVRDSRGVCAMVNCTKNAMKATRKAENCMMSDAVGFRNTLEL